MSIQNSEADSITFGRVHYDRPPDKSVHLKITFLLLKQNTFENTNFAQVAYFEHFPENVTAKYNLHKICYAKLFEAIVK